MSVAATRAMGTTLVVSTESTVDSMTAELLWDLYCVSFASLQERAAARQLLTRAEFDLEVVDPRVTKYLVRTEQGRIMGLCTLSNDLTTVPWISPGFYQARYPCHFARQAVFYCGLAMVHPEARATGALMQMVSAFAEDVADADGVLAADMCRYNIDVGELATTVTAVLNWVWGSASLVELDVQTYLAWEPRREIPLPRSPRRDELSAAAPVDGG
jgi:hypothetical protein